MRNARWFLPLSLGALALTACAPGPHLPAHLVPSAEPPTPQATSETAPAQTMDRSAAPACALADTLTPEQQVGQLFMLGVDTSGLTDGVEAAIRDGQLGSVVLLGNTTAGQVAVSTLVSELDALGSPELPILVAVDQEGGQVQRLQGEGFSTIPNAQLQGEMPATELETAALTWGAELFRTGIRYNLAPVADVVPADRVEDNAPIGALRRNFGTDEETVSAATVAVVKGMGEAGVMTSLKHFPGLGRVSVNTDDGAAVDSETTAGARDLAPFAAGIEAGASSVMVSSAVYEQIDPDNQAVFSRTVITDVLRGELGFDGVVISDDLGAAGSVTDVPPADRATRFFAAGGDLLINADPRLMGEMADAVAERATADPSFAEQVRAAATRVLLLKEKAGLIECG